MRQERSPYVAKLLAVTQTVILLEIQGGRSDFRL
jgi:hypothetical protein